MTTVDVLALKPASEKLDKASELASLPLQETSLDIWDKKYRLKTKEGDNVDETILDTFKRVARALADVEPTKEAREYWYAEFLWALEQGAIPAGRITSNAGALAHKPATSTINCTVSGTITDSMDDILGKVHEAGLTLKAGCVAPETRVVTEAGVVSAERAVLEKHETMLCYDKESGCFEMRRIEQHMTTHVPRSENIELVSNGTTLKTSVKHPVLVYRNDKLLYTRADDVRKTDALVHHHFAWTAETAGAERAWFAGAHLGDGSAYEKHFAYRSTNGVWAEKASTAGRRLVFKIRAAEREVVERYAEFFQTFCGSGARVVATGTPNGTPVWDYAVSSFKASRAIDLVDGQIGKKTHTLRVPRWVAEGADRFFLPFLAGLIDTDGTVTRERGSASIAMQSHDFADELKALLGLFGVHGAITHRKPREHDYKGSTIRDSGGAMLKISDSAFLACVAEYMADSGKKRRIVEHAARSGQYDRYVLPAVLAQALADEVDGLRHQERLDMGIYHGYHRKDVVSRIWLDKWEARFPHLKETISFARTLRPMETVRRNLDIGETFYDFTVERHHNYLAGEGGLMVIHNCGIGYDFSTLRPRGAYVSGAGAYTSGPLSFMDIFDKMCFTVSSAGGRRGAQMGTFDVRHPDVLEFIKAKREDGRLRQFNLSLLITEDFIQAVKADEQWQLAFPIRQKELADGDVELDNPDQIVWRDWPSHVGVVVNDEGLVACRIYRTLPARRLWDLIMASTYDFAEPGFILVDKVNEMNNNWFDESIRATNPCVTADTWVQTSEGPRQVSELIDTPFNALVDGTLHSSGAQGFFKTATKDIVTLSTTEGHALQLTADHKVRRVSSFTRYTTDTEWCAAGDLKPGDRVLLNDHRSRAEWDGDLNEDEGYLLGLLVGDGTVNKDNAVLSVWAKQAGAVASTNVSGTHERCDNTISAGASAVMDYAESAVRNLGHKADTAGWSQVSARGEYRLSTSALQSLAQQVGIQPDNKSISPELEKASSSAYKGFLRGFFDANGLVQGTQAKGVSVRLSQPDLPSLEAVQRMLLRLGINSSITSNLRSAGTSSLQDDVLSHAKGESELYATKVQHELVVSGENLARFSTIVGFNDTDKQALLNSLLQNYKGTLNRERFVARVASVKPAGISDVYDVQIPGINTFDANGLHAHNCGEQPLPPYGACLLGSINLTRFVIDPFTINARFDWERYTLTVEIFTRMLDNVVEINGLPLEQQQKEIVRKRRHGMGYLGLGSSLTLMGLKYGSPESLEFTEKVTREMAVSGWRTALQLSKEKGPAPIMDETFDVTAEMLRKRPEMKKDGYKAGDTVKGRVLHAKYSRYMQRIAEVDPQLVEELAEHGARFTHHTSIAPTGTISLSLANNASNGIEPSFAHHYARNVIREGRKSKEKVDVFSFELLAYQKLINDQAMPYSEDEDTQLPDYFMSADDITPRDHVSVQAAAQRWIDSSISKTANVPTDYPFEDFKDIYMYAYDQGLKGCTTFRFNPENFQGVLVKEQDLENTNYEFTLEDGSVVSAKGNEQIEYDGETHTAANLYDALKEGYYGKF